MPGADEAFALEVLVGPARRDDAAREIAGQRPDGGELRSRLKLAAEDEVAQLGFDLPVHRLRVVQREVQRDAHLLLPRAHAERSLVSMRRVVMRERSAKAAPPARTEKMAGSAP